MKHVTFFDAATGALHHKSVLVSDDDAVELNTPPGHVAIEHPQGAMLDALSQRVDIETGAVVDYQPQQPSGDHEWSAATKRWQLTHDAQAQADQVAAARARHATLIISQHDDVRRALLGDAAALERLRAIETEVSGPIKSVTGA